MWWSEEEGERREGGGLGGSGGVEKDLTPSLPLSLRLNRLG